MNRNHAERRHNDWSKAIRKHRLCREKLGMDWYKNLHQYSKNKIHCSCRKCRAKTNEIPSYGTNYRMGKKNWSVNDLRKIQSMLDCVIDSIENSYDDVPFYEPDYEDEIAFENAYDYQHHYDNDYGCYADQFNSRGEIWYYPCDSACYVDDDPWNY